MINLRKAEKDMSKEELIAYRKSLFGYTPPERHMTKQELFDYRLPLILILCGEFDIQVYFLQPKQLRLSANNYLIDIYPQSCKFFDIRKRQWGIFDFNDLENFLKQQFKISE